MQKLLTINIVTADRACLGLCLARLKVLPSIQLVDVHIFDNSKTSIQDSNKILAKNYGFDYWHFDDFITCRNESLKNTKTEYFTILDDDDWLTTTSIDMIIHYIKMYPDVDYFSYGTGKQCRVDNYDCKVHLITNNIQKLWYLNKFDNYKKDRTTKIYLWNSANVYKTFLANSVKGWKYKGCDDILPVTSMYLKAKKVLKVNQLMVQYPSQQTVLSDKPIDKLIDLSDNMYKSYSELLEEFGSKIEKLIIRKAIRNSIRQMQVLDKYNPVQLIKLLEK